MHIPEYLQFQIYKWNNPKPWVVFFHPPLVSSIKVS